MSPLPSEPQRPRLLHLRQGAHLGRHVGRQLAVDLDQRDGVAAGRFAADMEGRDIDAGVPFPRVRSIQRGKSGCLHDASPTFGVGFELIGKLRR